MAIEANPSFFVVFLGKEKGEMPILLDEFLCREMDVVRCSVV